MKTKTYVEDWFTITMAVLVSSIATGCSQSAPAVGRDASSAGGSRPRTGSDATRTTATSTPPSADPSGGATSNPATTNGSYSRGGNGDSGSSMGSCGQTNQGGTSSIASTIGGTGTTPPSAAGGTSASSAKGGTNASGGKSGAAGRTSQGGMPVVGSTAQAGMLNNGGATAFASATGGTSGNGATTATLAGGGGTCAPPSVALSGTDAVANGPLITFNDDGGWCWYQDERALIDLKNKKLLVGSVAFMGSRKSNIEAVIYDLQNRKAGTPAKLGNLGADAVDDHNAPAFALRPDGGYAAMWAGHNLDCSSYFSVYNGTAWSTQKTLDWTSFGCPTSSGKKITYSNLWYLGSDLISFVRSVDTSPNYLLAKDNGTGWSFGGRLTATPRVGYVAGYYKYWGNNTDRLDFVATEAHPRDNDNSLYSGYIQDNKIYKSTGGDPVDAKLADDTAKDITEYTVVFKTGGKVGNVTLSNVWNSDLVRYADGTLGLIWTGRVGSKANDDLDTDLRLLYGRFDGATWKLTYLVKAGPKLYSSEQDYTGLGALHPDDPKTIFVSTPYDPRDETKAPGKREIWRGTTCDSGATFKWTQVTANSTKDNIRPIVPKWDADHTALLWMRGEYRAAQDMTMAIVGTITGP